MAGREWDGRQAGGLHVPESYSRQVLVDVPVPPSRLVHCPNIAPHKHPADMHRPQICPTTPYVGLRQALAALCSVQVAEEGVIGDLVDGELGYPGGVGNGARMTVIGGD